MEPLIYYPTFEPPTERWLKYALLYFEEFRPIIPEAKLHLVSNTFRNVRENSDLINPYSPDQAVGYRASVKAIEEAEKMLSKNYQRSFLFGKHSLETHWQNPLNFTFKIYSGKFSHEWMDFCLE